MEICKLEPHLDFEDRSHNLTRGEYFSSEDMPCKQEDADSNDVALTRRVKTEPEDDIKPFRTEMNPFTAESSTVKSMNQDNENICENDVGNIPSAIMCVKTEMPDENDCNSQTIYRNESKEFNLCKICNSSFIDYQDFEDHMQSHSKIEVEGNVDVKPFVSPLELENGDYKCEICLVAFNVEVDFEIHMVDHTNSSECRRCGKAFKRKNSLINHLVSCTTKDLYKCHLCKKQMSSKQLYIAHLKLHAGDRTYICHECDKIFTMQSALSAHIRHVHNNIRPFACHICNKTFYNKSTMVKHVRIHTGEKPFSCSMCGKAFTQKSSIGKHMILHGVYKNVCEYCNKSFVKQISLIRHLRRAKHSYPYQCDNCNKPFVLQKDLERHVCVKTDEKVEIVIID